MPALVIGAGIFCFNPYLNSYGPVLIKGKKLWAFPIYAKLAKSFFGVWKMV